MIITNLHKRYSLILLTVFSSLAVTACDNSNNAGQSSLSNKQAVAHVVETTQVRMQSVQNQLATSGTIEAGTKVRLYNEVSARIRHLPFYEGDTIAANTIIIGLDDAIIQAELDKATATREQAKIDYDRLKKLRKQLASDEEIARASTAYDIAVADEQLQRTRLGKTVIKAPFDGVITERHYELGDVVPMHSHIMSMIDPESLQVRIYLAEHWIPQIEVGDKVDIQIDALSNALHPGRIIRIHPTIDADTRKGIVEIEFQPVPLRARAGQLARVYLKTRPSDRLVVPAHALHHDAKGAYVYVVDQNSTCHKTYINKGAQYGNAIEITSGINNNDTIVIKGFNGLRHGKKVQVLNPEGNDIAGSS
ncbi:MAG: efflux RND transporter periplasmic adaptor subunit [Gammaproteobacteria bacterium]